MEPELSRRSAQTTAIGSARLPRTPEWREIAANAACHCSATGVPVHLRMPTTRLSTGNERACRPESLPRAKCDWPAAECSAAENFAQELLPDHIPQPDRPQYLCYRSIASPDCSSY